MKRSLTAALAAGCLLGAMFATPPAMAGQQDISDYATNKISVNYLGYFGLGGGNRIDGQFGGIITAKHYTPAPPFGNDRGDRGRIENVGTFLQPKLPVNDEEPRLSAKPFGGDDGGSA